MKKKEKKNSWIGKVSYAYISLFAFLAGAGLLMLFVFNASDLGREGLIDKIYYVLLIPFALSAASFLFKVLSSRATFSGSLWGGMLRLGGPVVLFCLIMIGGFKLVPSAPGMFTYTIFLQDSEGRAVLKNNGEMTLLLDGTPRTEPIDRNGSATFKGIPSAFRNNSVSLRLNANGWWFKNHQYSRSLSLDGSSKTLVLERDKTLSSLSGYIYDHNQQPIANATVWIHETEKFHTNENGWFKINIPPDKQKEIQRLYIDKNGYKPQNLNVTPASNQEVSIELQSAAG